MKPIELFDSLLEPLLEPFEQSYKMLPDILINIFYYLKNYTDLSLVCKEWRSLALKSRHGKIIQRLNQIETNISAKSQLFEIAKDLAALFYQLNQVQKLIKLQDFTKKPEKIWWEIDRCSQYFSTETICDHFFELFDKIYLNDDTNLIATFEPKTWKKLVKKIKFPIDFSLKDSYGHFYSLVHKEHRQKLKAINKIIRPFRDVFRGTSDFYMGMIYDRLLTIDLKTIKKSCKKLAPLFDNEELLDMSLGYTIGHIPLHDGEMGEEHSLKYWWVGFDSDGRWFAMKLMTSIFDENLIKHRMKCLKMNFNLKKVFFNQEFKCTIDVFMNIMKLTESAFQLLIEHKDICWIKDKDWYLPLTMVDIPFKKLNKRFKIISKASKDGLRLDPLLLEMNTSCLQRFIDFKLSQLP